MACFRGLGLTFTVLMIVGTVRGRWLELEPNPTSSSMISDGIHDVNLENTWTVYGEKRCESIYGFLPCADTMEEGVFLMFMYTYLMILGEEWIGRGSETLFSLLGNYKVIGGSVFRVLMAFPKIVLVIVAGIYSTESDAEYQVAFGLRMYAGSTLLTLTLIWGIYIYVNRDKLLGKESISVEDSSTKCLPLIHKLSLLNDNGVSIDKGTRQIAGMMLLSLIPFVTVELAALIKSPVSILFALIVSGVSLVVYFAYQIWDPWLQVRSLAYLRKENLQIRLLYHIGRLAKENLIDEHGNPNFKAFESIFLTADEDKDGCISHHELEVLIEKELKLNKDHISLEYAKTEILIHFDDDKSGKITWLEFKKGCTKWLQKSKENTDTTTNSVTKNLWKKVKKVAIKNKRENLTQIEMIMPTIMRQVLEKHDLVKENGDADREKIGELFSQYDRDSDRQINRNEIKDFIKPLLFRVPLEDGKVFDELAKDFGNGNNDRDNIHRHEFVEGFSKWIHKAIAHDPSIKDPRLAIAKFEKNSWFEIDTPINKPEPKTNIVFLIVGLVMMFVISGGFTQSIQQFSNAAQIPFHLTSFAVFPIAMNAKMVFKSLGAGPRVSKNASLTFSEVYNGLVMNNLLGLLTLLAIVYAKGLSWTYSNEVLTIMVPCAAVGIFALKRDTYPLWASITAVLLYPIYAYVYCVFGS
ncbi:hypothetical protein SSX86_023544 [Deinandra increscens subsp. villosa]|uniref:EF-hand domain-containing protein n=1 Tax=Deinandra increscens subsp. villosa TaxID=3103831 RepID=A0AAP0CR86_9ASTR